MHTHALRTAAGVTLLALLASAVSTATAIAASPIPTFDKEAVTTRPYQRTGQQEVITGKDKETYRPGNTGTEEAPAFYVEKIEIAGTKLKSDWDEDLASILKAYSGRSVEPAELDTLMDEITACYKKAGYTIPQAVILPQEVKDGLLRVTVYTARYDAVNITNTSDVYDTAFTRYTRKLKEGDIITDRQLENAMNLLNDLPAVTARAVMRPGVHPGTTIVDIEGERRPVWNNYIFTDNGGGYYSGRWRFGFQSEINNPGHMGDKITVNGMITEEKVKNYAVRYETPLGPNGTRVGVAYSRSNYDLRTNDMYDSLGESKGYSLYGMTPLYRDKTDRITAIYGYDRRNITDRLHFRNINGLPEIRTEKRADVWHAGISGSQYNVNQFLQYSLIYWYGDMETEGGAYYDGGYHKLTGDLLDIIYDGKWNYRWQFSGQLANRALDGSEQFYLGGMNGVRAYGASDGYGDYGFLSTFEIRRQTSVEGLEFALFLDHGVAGDKAAGTLDHLTGWGAGLRYGKPNDWYAQLDVAKKINARRDRTEPDDHDGRVWFQLYKMF